MTPLQQALDAQPADAYAIVYLEGIPSIQQQAPDAWQLRNCTITPLYPLAKILSALESAKALQGLADEGQELRLYEDKP